MALYINNYFSYENVRERKLSHFAALQEVRINTSTLEGVIIYKNWEGIVTYKNDTVKFNLFPVLEFSIISLFDKDEITVISSHGTCIFYRRPALVGGIRRMKCWESSVDMHREKVFFEDFQTIIKNGQIDYR